MSVVYNDTRNYSAPKDIVFKEALNALNALGFKIKSSNETSGVIEAKKGMSIWTWGEHIRILISPLKEGSSVYVESCVKYQIIDYGKNRENVIKIFTELDRRILST